jgi:prepilin-type N-terminal cleavage/methylation domain-containing protein
MKKQGLTLVEMMMVIVLLAVGIIAAAGMQGTALSLNRKAKILQTVNGIADAEVSLRRQVNLTAVNSEACKTTVASGYSCTVTIIPCTIQSQAFSCSGSASPIRAYQISIAVSGPLETAASLQTIAAVDQ